MVLNTQRPPQSQKLVPILLHKPLVELWLPKPLRAVAQVPVLKRPCSMLVDRFVAARVSGGDARCEVEAKDGFEGHFDVLSNERVLGRFLKALNRMMGMQRGQAVLSPRDTGDGAGF